MKITNLTRMLDTYKEMRDNKILIGQGAANNSPPRILAKSGATTIEIKSVHQSANHQTITRNLTQPKLVHIQRNRAKIQMLRRPH